MRVSAYPVCYCGHRYDHHRDPGDPRGGGCHLCVCHTYTPNHETAEQREAKRTFERAIFGDNRVFK